MIILKNDKTIIAYLENYLLDINIQKHINIYFEISIHEEKFLTFIDNSNVCISWRGCRGHDSM
jgi:hypothetical protein